ncbi:antibiotic biosynthesis monooxygenase [Novosphingobium barchaimii LL02]|uniref:Antibiotic biosynthesis monooxygenase n=1 Tax=Novosphingobium barchaimii LL02 TaxID=1114963 RepID=A0A0J7XJL6_9SPHN|nr:putative quinol monooxygenase [Novosphingobium barchaimii]KMS51907.1 antibiotic biosynthesis monooxygenase [Novosphingobium barchaimii LL02]
MRIPLKVLAIPVLTIAALTTPAAAQQTSAAKVTVDYPRVPEGAWSIVAEVRAKPGKAEQLREATLPLVELVRGDPKNLVYFLQEDRAESGHFIFYEIFATREDFEAHNAMPYVQAWFAKLPELADGSVDVMQMGVLGQNQR